MYLLNIIGIFIIFIIPAGGPPLPAGGPPYPRGALLVLSIFRNIPPASIICL
jgi:hypothetical protein